MKRTAPAELVAAAAIAVIIAVAALVAAAAFATAAFAATTVPAPTMPSDLASNWESTGPTMSCKKPDGVVITVASYEKNDGSAMVSKFTRNDEPVALYEISGTSNSVSVKQADRSWKKYDRMVERAEGLAAVVSAIGLTPQEFTACVD